MKLTDKRLKALAAGPGPNNKKAHLRPELAIKMAQELLLLRKLFRAEKRALKHRDAWIWDNKGIKARRAYEKAAGDAAALRREYTKKFEGKRA